MVKLQIFHDEVIDNGVQIPVYDFESCYKISILGGDSGTGKSMFYDILARALDNIDGWSIESNKEIYMFSTLNQLQNIIDHEKDKLIICDENEITLILKSKLVNKLYKSQNYFLLIARDLVARVETNVKALFEMKGTGRIYNGIEVFDIITSR